MARRKGVPQHYVEGKAQPHSYMSPPIKLFDADVMDVAAALFFIWLILYILVFISIYIHNFSDLIGESKTPI